MKTLLLIFAIISSLLLNSHCQNALGNETQLNVLSNQSNPNSCRLNVYSDVDYIANASRAYTNISQSYDPSVNATPSSSLPANCSFVQLDFTSFFDDCGDSEIDYTLPVHYNYYSNGSIQSAFVNTTITAAALVSMNGTECVILKQNQSSYDQYLCQIDYAGIPLYWVVYGSGSGSNFTFSNFYNASSKWVLSYIYNFSETSSYAIVDLNSSFPDVVADIYSFCGAPNKNFYSLYSWISITASANLSALLGINNFNVSQAYVLVKRDNATDPGDYISYESSAFVVPAGQSCWTVGITWSQVLPDMAYCADGCNVTIIFANNANKIYVLQTSGLNTTSPF